MPDTQNSPDPYLRIGVEYLLKPYDFVIFFFRGSSDFLVVFFCIGPENPPTVPELLIGFKALQI